MTRRRAFQLILICGLLIPVGAAAAPAAGALPSTVSAPAPLAGPCPPGATYDPACDVDHNDAITITDIQLTASRWGTSGAWMSDNGHNHLGQTWTGSSNPLKLVGSYAAPDFAALVLRNNNVNGWGLKVEFAGDDGVKVVSANGTGVQVDSATDGVYVFQASADGVGVGTASDDGVAVCRTGNAAVCAPSPNKNGVEIGYTQHNGLYVDYANTNGIDVAGANYAANFFGSIIITNGVCVGCTPTTFAVNTGDADLTPGDIVSLVGLRESGVDSVPVLMEVRPAEGGDQAVGVVQGWAELVAEDDPRAGEVGLRLAPREGAARPGQFVTIVYSGLMQVRVSGPVAEGSKLAVGENGTARTLRTVNVEGVELAENASVVGLALESNDGNGLVWTLVNVR